MKTTALLLALSLPLQASAQPAPPPSAQAASSEATVEISTSEIISESTITVTANRYVVNPDTGTLKIVRGAGLGAAAGGAGMLAYMVAFDAAGPIGWATGLIFMGGMSAYLAHRRLHGHDDMSADEARNAAAAQAKKFQQQSPAP